MRRVGYLVLALVLCGSMIGCQISGPEGYQPPDLGGDREGLTLDEMPGAGGVEGGFPDDGTYLGYLFEAPEGATYDILLTRTSGSDVPALVLYQFDASGYSEAIAWASADADGIQIGGWMAEQAGTYLILVDVVEGDRTGTFRLEVECTSGCEQPECRTDDDCPWLDQVCEDGLCVEKCMDLDQDGFCQDLDCDDGDPSVFPGAVDTCDGIDNDCDGIDNDCDVNTDCVDDRDCGPGQVCQAGTCLPSGAGQAGDLCDLNVGCAAGLECLLFDEAHGYCAGSCDCEQGQGCEAPAECMWTDGQSCWCGYSCQTNSDCPGGGQGWTCYDVGSEYGDMPFFACLPLDMDQPECYSDADCPAGSICDGWFCVAECADFDADGWCQDWDCDDRDPAINPGAYDPCDGIDNDCDGIDNDCDGQTDDCQSNDDCPAGEMCVMGVCHPVGDGQAGDLCDQNSGCEAGLECLLMDEDHGYCAGLCDCNQGDGCEDPSECLWSDGETCWCGYTCQITADCPGGGDGWTCYDIGSEFGEDPFLACLPMVM